MRYYIDDPPSQNITVEAADTTPATIVLSGASNWIHSIETVIWSFINKPKPGQLTIVDVGTGAVLLRRYISDKTTKELYNGQIIFPGKGLSAANGSEVTITLLGTVTKSLTVQYR